MANGSAALKVAGKSHTNPKANVQGKCCNADVFKLTDIPGAMDKMDWTNSANMMRNWFSNPPWEMKADDRKGGSIDYRAMKKAYPYRVDDQIIKIDWILNTPRIQPVFKDLCQNWANAKGVERLLIKLLPKQGWQPGGFCQLGHNNGVELIDAIDMDGVCDINSRRVGRYTDVLDDFYGAIFMATLKMAVIGTAYYDAARDKDIFEVRKLGVYLRDTYDFNSAWWEDSSIGLGVWGKERMLTKAEMSGFLALHTTLKASSPGSPQWIAVLLALATQFPGFVKITNGHFREYRDKYVRGGDFYVFTDVKWLPLNVKEIIL